MKIQRKIILTFVTLTVGIVLLVSIMEYYFANQNTFEDFYKRLEIRAIVAAKAEFEQTELGSNAYEDIRRQHLEKLLGEKEYFIPADNIATAVAASGLKTGDKFFDEALRDGEARYRSRNIFYLGYLYANADVKYIVVIEAKNELIDSYLTNLQRIIIISFISTIIIALLAGISFSNFILSPLRTITHKMQEISAGRLHLRLPVKGKDEIADLTNTFNNMLDRLEATFETQKNFISNASHELNTPLTSIIGESEYAMSKPRAQEDYLRSLSVILSDAERLHKITKSLLHLAQTGYSDKDHEFQPVRIDEIVYIAKETVDNIIPENNIYLNLSLMPEDQGKLVIKGDQQLLELAIVNLLINACKYSSNKPVPVTIAAANHKVIVVIEDNGIGIPQNEIAYIYEPFFRASNTGKFNGYGIGLPLTRNIIRMHSGELDVTSEENVGTKIKITLPVA
jgi:signal transduction histidine kinase